MGKVKSPKKNSHFKGTNAKKKKTSKDGGGKVTKEKWPFKGTDAKKPSIIGVIKGLEC